MRWRGRARHVGPEGHNVALDWEGYPLEAGKPVGFQGFTKSEEPWAGLRPAPEEGLLAP